MNRVLVVHNTYRQRGGEDSVVESEISLLREHGHAVKFYMRCNDEISTMSPFGLAAQTLWSSRTMIESMKIIEVFSPDIIHVHNTFPLISPSIYWAASRAGVPIVQTLHNFRLLCPQAMFLHNGRVCEDCLGALPWRGVIRSCYRDSRAQTSVLAGMLTLHRTLGTWQDKVTRYIALNDFCRDKFIQGGLPAERISVKSNFVDVAKSAVSTRAGGLFVGRLSPEKGIAVLLGALDFLPQISIEFIGIGPELDRVKSHSWVNFLGAKSQSEVMEAMSKASFLVMPSIWYENFPRTLVESFACGLPVIASRLGAMTELVSDGETGLLFEPGNAEDLAQKIAWAEANPDKMRKMGELARLEYEAKYTSEINYGQLMAIYEDAIAAVKQDRTH